MKVIDVYRQYFAADCEFNTVQRNGAVVCLTATSEEGNIKYEVSVSFFPHSDEEDFAVSYDAYGSRELFCNKGRRSKKRDQEFIAQIQPAADEIAKSMSGEIFWDKPLCQAQYG